MAWGMMWRLNRIWGMGYYSCLTPPPQSSKIGKMGVRVATYSQLQVQSRPSNILPSPTPSSKAASKQAGTARSVQQTLRPRSPSSLPHRSPVPPCRPSPSILPLLPSPPPIPHPLHPPRRFEPNISRLGRIEALPYIHLPHPSTIPTYSS